MQFEWQSTAGNRNYRQKKKNTPKNQTSFIKLTVKRIIIVLRVKKILDF